MDQEHDLIADLQEVKETFDNDIAVYQQQVDSLGERLLALRQRRDAATSPAAMVEIEEEIENVMALFRRSLSKRNEIQKNRAAYENYAEACARAQAARRLAREVRPLQDDVRRLAEEIEKFVKEVEAETRIPLGIRASIEHLDHDITNAINAKFKGM